jgi:thymidylate kinase
MFKVYKAKLIVFVSPDGGGKTTTINALEQKISKRYIITRSHIRFNILPRLGQLMFRIRHPLHKQPVFVKSVSESGVPVKKHIYAANVSIWKILIVLAYETFDYLLGYFSLFSRSERSVYIFDRYIYDYFTEKNWVATPKWLVRLIMSVIPTPCLVVVLKNDPEVIHARKAELSVEDIRYTQNRIDELLLGDNNVFEVSTCIPAEEIAEKIIIRAGLL